MGIIGNCLFQTAKLCIFLCIAGILGRFFCRLRRDFWKICTFAPSSIDKTMEGYKKCPYCGEEIPESATKCMYCTAWLNEPQAAAQSQPQPRPVQPQPQPINVQSQPVRQKNGPGTAGLVLSILGLVLCWVPIANVILWFLGFLFSFIGMFKRPKGKAIAGLVISIVSLVVLIVLFSVLGNALLESDAMDELFNYY